MVEIRKITRENAGDLNLKNEPFELPGRFIPQLQNGKWGYHTEPFSQVGTDIFPDENYDYEECCTQGVVFGAYEKGRCIGLAVYRDYFLKHMYLYDLKVCGSARGRGVGKALIRAGMEAALERGYVGLYTQAQDNNLNACMFYLSAGFQIGGFDNHVYNGTSQEGKADIIFYLNQ